jgi:hypothetical protein
VPKFSIKDLLIATTLIALGLGAVLFAFNDDDTNGSYLYYVVMSSLILIGVALVGAGIAFPFKMLRRKTIGMLLGILVLCVLYALLLVFIR